MNNNIQETPEYLVTDGKMNFGLFSEPFRNINFHDLATTKDGKRKPLKKTRLKEWVGYGVEHPEWFFTIFFMDSKILSSALFYAYNRVTGKTIKASPTVPGSRKLPETLWAGKYKFRVPGFQMSFDINLDRGTHIIDFDIKKGIWGPGINGRMIFHENLSKLQPLVINMPLVDSNNMYSHKGVLPAEGKLFIGSDEINLKADRDISILDEHRSQLAYKSKWKWGTFAGRDSQGRLIALNIGDQDTVEDQDIWGENCIWVDGKLFPIGRAEFDFSRTDRMEPWHITEKTGRADVNFFPEGIKEQNTNVGIVKVKYFQLCGKFRGTLLDENGEKLEVKDYYGVAECMDAKF
ncbi:MAG TPA: DUF2804 domain-containing protein [bacterium]|nr:DUF2804 domain-containing protein [bacterium]